MQARSRDDKILGREMAKLKVIDAHTLSTRGVVLIRCSLIIREI